MGKVVGSILEPFTGAKATRRAAENAARQQAEAARQGGYAAAFRPVGLTTRFGTSRFTETIDPVTGLPRVTGAGYELSPELKAIQDRIFGLTGGALTTAEEAEMAARPLGEAAQGLFGLAGRIIPTDYDPRAAAQSYYQEAQAMLDPTRQREEARLGAGVFGRGRAGLSIGSQGQPELFALAQAREEQNAALAAQARERARAELQQDIGIGSGLFGTGASLLGQQYGIPTQALGPLQSYLGTVESIEQLGRQPFDLSMALGGASQAGSQAGGQMLSSGLMNAAQTRVAGEQAANTANLSLLSGLLGAGANIYGMSRIGTGSMFGTPRGTPGFAAPITGVSSVTPGFSSGAPAFTAGYPQPTIYPVASWGGTVSPIR
jgi:hypothetical protein